MQPWDCKVFECVFFFPNSISSEKLEKKYCSLCRSESRPPVAVTFAHSFLETRSGGSATFSFLFWVACVAFLEFQRQKISSWNQWNCYFWPRKHTCIFQEPLEVWREEIQVIFMKVAFFIIHHSERVFQRSYLSSSEMVGFCIGVFWPLSFVGFQNSWPDWACVSFLHTKYFSYTYNLHNINLLLCFVNRQWLEWSWTS